MAGKNYHQGFNVVRSPRGLKDRPWIHDDLNVLQLGLFERTVVRIAGEMMIEDETKSESEVLFLDVYKKYGILNDILR